MQYRLRFLSILLACTTLTLNAQEVKPALEWLWTLDGLDSPESVVVNHDGTYLYVSNVNGGGGDKDGNGYISRVSLTGELLEKQWLTGLNAPKGLAVGGGKLYVSDIDQLVVINIDKAEVAHRIDVKGSSFLNDVAIDQSGQVLISDSGNGTIYRLNDDNHVSVWVEDSRFGGINGLLPNGDELLITTMGEGELLSMSMVNQSIDSIAGEMENADGIALLPGGGYLVSAWPGELFYVSDEGGTEVLLDTQEKTQYMNDFLLMGDILLVPNWQPGSLTAYRVQR